MFSNHDRHKLAVALNTIEGFALEARSIRDAAEPDTPLKAAARAVCNRLETAARHTRRAQGRIDAIDPPSFSEDHIDPALLA